MNMMNKPSFLTRLMLAFAAATLAATAFAVPPAAAQIQSVDPNDAIGTDDGDPAATDVEATDDTTIQDGVPTDGLPPGQTTPDVMSPPVEPAPPSSEQDTTYQQDDLIGAAEGVFGKGSKGLAGIIEKILKLSWACAMARARSITRWKANDRLTGQARRSGSMWVPMRAAPSFWSIIFMILKISIAAILRQRASLIWLADSTRAICDAVMLY